MVDKLNVNCTKTILYYSTYLNFIHVAGSNVEMLVVNCTSYQSLKAVKISESEKVIKG